MSDSSTAEARQVTKRLERAPKGVRPTLTAARRLVRRIAPDAKEIAYRGEAPPSTRSLWKLVRYAVEGSAEYSVAIGTYPDHVLLFFPRGRELDDGSGLLEGKGKAFRFIALRRRSDVGRPNVIKLVRRAFDLPPATPRKASFVLIPGAGGMAWYWHRVVPLLERAKHEAIAVDLPGDDARAGVHRYAERVVEAIGERSNVILVAQSLGGFTAPLVCARAPVSALVLVNAMIPLPGETAGAWWENTGAVRARLAAAARGGYAAEFDVATYFLHDVPETVLRGGPQHQREQAPRPFEEACEFDGWPRIPIHVVASEGDRFFPVDFQKRVARARLRKDAEVVPGGHLVALSNPRGLARHLLAVAKTLQRSHV
jgi:pimeloyl-ACP methyl ester carboxylesterase